MGEGEGKIGRGKRGIMSTVSIRWIDAPGGISLHEVLRGLSATAELLIVRHFTIYMVTVYVWWRVLFLFPSQH